MSKEPESQPEERFPVGTSLYRAFFDKDSIWVRNIVVEAVDYEYTPKRKKRKAVYTVKGMNCTWRNGERLRKMDEAEIAGESDTIGSFALMDKALGYEGQRNRLAGINHATGHAPPRYALEAAYSFLERYLSSTR